MLKMKRFNREQRNKNLFSIIFCLMLTRATLLCSAFPHRSVLHGRRTMNLATVKELKKLAGSSQLTAAAVLSTIKNYSKIHDIEHSKESLNILLESKQPFTDQDFLLIFSQFCRMKDTESATAIAQKLGVMVDDNRVSVDLRVSPKTTEQVLGELALSFEKCRKFGRSLKLLEAMSSAESDELPVSLMRVYLAQSDKNLLCLALSRLLDFNKFQDFRSLQLLSGNLCKSMEFVKGAVSIETLPAVEQNAKEILFIGRSNVGKSSLVNMLTNRKNFAYVSKMPGKTREFNYFRVEGSIGEDSTLFYLVDVPGVGFAKRSKGMRSEWFELLSRYTQSRASLGLILHLVDSRHGLLDADLECLELLSSLPQHVEYCLVFTKLDKIEGAKPNWSKRAELTEQAYAILGKYTKRVVPAIFTSSQKNFGGVNIWNAVLQAIQ